MTRIAGSGVPDSEFGSISHRYGSADPDQDPHQNVIDPLYTSKIREEERGD
jgi:hypothetical protein